MYEIRKVKNKSGKKTTGDDFLDRLFMVYIYLSSNLNLSDD